MSERSPGVGEVQSGDLAAIRGVALAILRLEFGEALSRSDTSTEALVGQAEQAAQEILGEVAHERERRDALRQALARSRFLQAARSLAAVSFAASLVGAALGIPFIGPIGAGIVMAALLGIFVEGITGDPNGDPARFAGSDEPTASLRERRHAAEREYDTVLRRAVRVWLSEKANVVLGDVYEAELPDLNPTGLAEVDDPEREVPTEASDELEHLIERMPAGSIGIAGPRGAGKTTVLRRVTGEGESGVGTRTAKPGRQSA